MGDRWLEWLVVAAVGVGFTALIVWVNFYALNDDSPNPGDDDFRSGPDVDPIDHAEAKPGPKPDAEPDGTPDATPL